MTTAPTPSAEPAPSSTIRAQPAATTRCPSGYIPPDPARPVVNVAFNLGADRRNVNGRETLDFRPDRAVSELVFRLWPNSPRPTAAGANLRVTALKVDGRATPFTVEQAGAPAGRTGTLLRAKLPASRPAGTTIRADLTFALRLPVGADDRYGSRPAVAWFGSAYPLLSFVRGRGFTTAPATRLFAEAAASEVYRLASLTVTARAADVVLATGTLTRNPVTVGASRRWVFAADAVRDVAVAVGRFRSVSTTAGGVPVRVAVATSLPDAPRVVLGRMTATFATHVNRLGPFPYRDLDVVVVPDLRGGVEFPGFVYLGTGQSDATPSHELAHEWFYGLVGDDQARDPWLDEAFATYTEALARGTAAAYSGTPPAAGRNRVGAPMTYWERYPSAYYKSVYAQGAKALLEARRAAGTAAFDRALRCYVRVNAHRVAAPADVARALADLPAAVRVLQRYGALPS